MGSRSRTRAFKGRRTKLQLKLKRHRSKQQQQQLVVYDDLPERMQTARKCQFQDGQGGCGQPANRVRYNVDGAGGIDRSSKQFRCDKHP